MLKNLTTKDLIRLNVNASNWEDAIYQSAKPLLLAKKIRKEYIEAIIDTVKKTGPYIVVTKNVALPHARSECGALESAIGITTLKKPIYFGNKENDPVKYLFCLSASDNTSHLEALSDLTNLLGKKDFYNVLDKADNADEIMGYIEDLK